MYWYKSIVDASMSRAARRRRLGPLLVAVFMEWSERARSRRQLRRLSPESLRDIGIDQTQADVEARKPFWRR